jgi:hypothetical protein
MENGKSAALPTFKELLEATPKTLNEPQYAKDLEAFEATITVYRDALICALTPYELTVANLTAFEKELVSAGAIAAIAGLCTILSVDLTALLALPSEAITVIAANATAAVHAIDRLNKLTGAKIN